MKILIFLTLVLVSAISYATAFEDACSDIAGTWTNTSAHYISYTCTQDGTKHFSCAYASVPQVGNACHMTYTGNWNVNTGTFDYSATYVSGTCPHNSWSGHMYLGNSCMQMADDYFQLPTQLVQQRGTYSGSTFVWNCEVPGQANNGGEYPSTFVGWFNETRAQFVAVLHDYGDGNFNFAGRTTQETVLMDTVHSTCSPLPDISEGTGGGKWSPNATNNWSVGWTGFYGAPPGGEYAPDALGWDTNDWGGVEYIDRLQHNYKQALPCTIIATQTMDIDCVVATGLNRTDYETHSITVTVSDGSATFKRNTTTSPSTTLGLKRKVWKWIDWLMFI